VIRVNENCLVISRRRATKNIVRASGLQVEIDRLSRLIGGCGFVVRFGQSWFLSLMIHLCRTTQKTNALGAVPLIGEGV
jgi:hypothetical protein